MRVARSTFHRGLCNPAFKKYKPMEFVLECPICREPYDASVKVPLILNCGHTLCKHCIESLRGRSLTVKCPSDRIVETRNTLELTVNYTLLQLQDFIQTDTVAKEKCHTHQAPISLICRTCSMNCCTKCIQSHYKHEILDVEHPTVLKEIEGKLTQVESKVRKQLKTSKKAEERVSDELNRIYERNGQLQTELTEFFEDLQRTITQKKQESFAKLETKFKDKLQIIQNKLTESSVKTKLYESQLDELLQVKAQFRNTECVDRAVACNNYLRKIVTSDNPQPTEINDLRLRLALDLSKVFPHHLGNVVFIENSPFDLLVQQFKDTLASFQGHKELYGRSNAEQKLSLELKSLSFCVFLKCSDAIVAKTHLLEHLYLENFGQDLRSLEYNVQRKIIATVGLGGLQLFDFSQYKHTYRCKVIYAQGILAALDALKSRDFDKTLKILHFFVIKWTEFELAETFLSVVLLQLCSEGFKFIKSMRLKEAWTLFALITKYTKFHFLPSTILYKQVKKSLSFVRNTVYNFVNGPNYSAILLKLNDCIQKLTEPCDFIIELDFSVREIQWNGNPTNEELAKRFLDAVYEFKEDSALWWQAYKMITQNNCVLNDNAQAALEKSYR